MRSDVKHISKCGYNSLYYCQTHRAWSCPQIWSECAYKRKRKKTLVASKVKGSMLEITIVVDTNDGDCTQVTNDISEEDLGILRPLIKAIKEFKPYRNKKRTHSHNWTTGECLREDLGEKEPSEIYGFEEEIMELFEDLLPATMYGFHTIERIEVCPKQVRERLL